MEQAKKIGERILPESFEESTRNMVHTATMMEKNYAVWRLPMSGVKHTIVGLVNASLTEDKTIEEMEPGFIFHPYDLDRSGIFIQADLHITSDSNQLAISPTLTALDVKEQFFQILSQCSGADKKAQYHHRNAQHDIKSTDSQEFIELVNGVKEQIAQGNLTKGVPSRIKAVKLPTQFDGLDFFHRLCDAYPNAFVSLVGTADAGTWIGATPELLVSLNRDKVFTTISLAGTKPFDQNESLGDVMWRQKEIEEQAMVSRYIINCFKKIRLREFDELGPKTTRAGNLIHLKTVFKVDTRQVSFPQLTGVMLELLHPTSAVCGMPKDHSYQWLMDNESFDRWFFSGYLGPVNIEEEINIFVNLRCMEWKGDDAIFYAGAGVTEDSDPVKEWEETELKINTLMNILPK